MRGVPYIFSGGAALTSMGLDDLQCSAERVSLRVKRALECKPSILSKAFGR